MKRLKSYIAAVCLLGACTSLDPGERRTGDVINVGGVDCGEMSIETKAANQDADKVDWLVQPLTNGLDIVYGLDGYTGAEAHQDVAILKLTDRSTDPATYTFTYRDDRREEVGEGNQAIWYNNGYHYFQGVYVPDRIRYTESIDEVEGAGKTPGLTIDQSGDNATGEESTLGNYTLLSHYLGMPANYRLTATIDRIKLPFRHRLARVVAFVLIDPEMNTHLKGYNLVAGKDDPASTSLRFCNVKVLQGVHDVGEAGEHHVLTPQWTTARKVIPHFDGLRGSYSYKAQTSYDDDFKFYYKETDDKTIELYPTSTGWDAVHRASADSKGLYNGYTMINYGRVPVYDIIVQPTYTNSDNVMYDEAGYPGNKATLAAAKNLIDFELELDNGLRYARKFEFDLNANYQTVVYLRISHERVDYNASGAEVWEEKKTADGWFGVNNDNGNTLSKAGSSWQRAYTYLNAFFSEEGYWTDTDGTVYPNGVTDGQFYNANKNDRDNAQYYTSTYAAQFVDKLLQAHKEGSHHGDYFVLQQNISIDARKIPDNFVFTGHLDAQDKTISLTHVDERVYKTAASLEGLYTRAGEVYSEWSIPELHVKHITPATYWQESELTYVAADETWYDSSTITWIEDLPYTQDEADDLNALHLVSYVKTPAEYYTQQECDEENSKLEHHPYTLVEDTEGRKPGEEGYIETREYDMENYVDGYEPWTTEQIKTPAEVIEPGEVGYVTTYEADYTPITTADIKVLAHWDTSAGKPHNSGDEKTPEVITYPLATESTVPALPATLSALKAGEYYTDEHGTAFVCPDLYQYSHNSPSYLFAGLNGDYTTNQEAGRTPWEANVHRENGGRWVPTAGYRAEVLNARMAEGFTLFKAEASPYTGNVQNCANGSTPVPNNTPDIPRYK